MRFFDNYVEINLGFKRQTYEKNFQKYLDDYAEDFADIKNRVLGENKEAEVEAVAAEIVAEAQSVLDAVKGRMNKENVRISLNMYAVTFLLPALLSFGENEMKPLTDAICDKWAVAFNNSAIKAATREHIQSGFKTKLCYVTTAVCENLKQPADCRELRLLKEYRDGYLMQTKEGEELVYAYYDIAPTIVKRIEKSDNRDAKYRLLWEQYIKPCVAMIENGQNEACRDKYVDMVTNLRHEYIEDYRA